MNDTHPGAEVGVDRNRRHLAKQGNCFLSTVVCAGVRQQQTGSDGQRGTNSSPPTIHEQHLIPDFPLSGLEDGLWSVDEATNNLSSPDNNASGWKHSCTETACGVPRRGYKPELKLHDGRGAISSHQLLTGGYRAELLCVLCSGQLLLSNDCVSLLGIEDILPKLQVVYMQPKRTRAQQSPAKKPQQKPRAPSWQAPTTGATMSPIAPANIPFAIDFAPLASPALQSFGLLREKRSLNCNHSENLRNICWTNKSLGSDSARHANSITCSRDRAGHCDIRLRTLTVMRSVWKEIRETPHRTGASPYSFWSPGDEVEALPPVFMAAFTRSLRPSTVRQNGPGTHPAGQDVITQQQELESYPAAERRSVRQTASNLLEGSAGRRVLKDVGEQLNSEWVDFQHFNISLPLLTAYTNDG